MSRLNRVFALLAFLAPSFAWACACGCGIFDVGTSSMFPTSLGGMVFLEYDYQDQNQNRKGTMPAAASDNNDLEVRTHFFTAGGQYMFNRTWGVQAEVPYWHRFYAGTDDSGNPVALSHNALGDIRLTGIYTGLSEDMSSGITFGVKLPTGDWKFAGLDRDTEIGTGSTDLLLGVYHLGNITHDGIWAWFSQLNLDQPVLSQAGYYPGNEIDGAIGAYYNGLTLKNMKFVPLAQLLTSIRGADSGSAADTLDSGYQRLLVAPGIEADLGNFKIYGDIEIPVYQHFDGFQLSASALYKVITSYSF